MSINAVNGVNGGNQVQPYQRVDNKELEVANKLVNAGIVNSVQEFMQLSETEKKAKVEEYNKTHPNDPIGDKNKRDNALLPPEAQTTQQTQGSELDKFRRDVNWKNVKLQ